MLYDLSADARADARSESAIWLPDDLEPLPAQPDARVRAVTTALARSGGVGTYAQLRAAGCPRRAVAAALRSGEVLRPARGRYHLALTEQWRALAHRHGGAAADLTAAVARGWPVVDPPRVPTIAVPRGRRLRRVEGVHLVRRVLSPQELRAGLVAPRAAVVGCARRLPFAEALAVADSALRQGDCSARELASWRPSGPDQARVGAVLAAADPGSASVLESLVRAACLGVPGLALRTQHRVVIGRRVIFVDLADPGLGIVIEADSYEFHATREGFVADCRRYTALTARGWLVLRFTWWDVRHRPEAVRSEVARAVARRRTVAG